MWWGGDGRGGSGCGGGGDGRGGSGCGGGGDGRGGSGSKRGGVRGVGGGRGGGEKGKNEKKRSKSSLSRTISSAGSHLQHPGSSKSADHAGTGTGGICGTHNNVLSGVRRVWAHSEPPQQLQCKML